MGVRNMRASELQEGMWFYLPGRDIPVEAMKVEHDEDRGLYLVQLRFDAATVLITEEYEPHQGLRSCTPEVPEPIQEGPLEEYTTIPTAYYEAMRACTEDIYEALMRQLHGLDPIHPLDFPAVKASARLLAEVLGVRQETTLDPQTDTERVVSTLSRLGARPRITGYDGHVTLDSLMGGDQDSQHR
jgi:hypothetical protein